jgi:hypothetical protein
MTPNDRYTFQHKLNTPRDKLFNYFKDNVDTKTHPDVEYINLLSKEEHDDMTVTILNQKLRDTSKFLCKIPSVGEKIFNSKTNIVWDNANFITITTVEPNDGELYKLVATAIYLKDDANKTIVHHDVEIFLSEKSALYFILLPFIDQVKSYIFERIKNDSKIMLEGMADIIGQS